MDATAHNPSPTKAPTTVERTSDRELVISRTFDGPARIVFEAWTRPELLKLWWAPKSTGLVLASCEADVRPGGRYRFEFGRDGSMVMAFFGRYLEVVPPSKLVWTNEESPQGSLTTLTFEERDGKTLLTLREVYPNKEALDEIMAGAEGGMDETLDQLAALLADRAARGGWPETGT
jgi:uncharacterized protein YndB with AHSA1/START domain